MAVADSAGLPLAVCIGDGSKHDLSLVDDVLDAAFQKKIPPKLIGDKGFDSRPLSERLAHRCIELIAPKRTGTWASRRKQDGRPLRRYRRRWKVERLFAWLKRFRRIALRWDYKAENFLGFLQLGCLVILLRQF
jgi:transposase